MNTNYKLIFQSWDPGKTPNISYKEGSFYLEHNHKPLDAKICMDKTSQSKIKQCAEHILALASEKNVSSDLRHYLIEIYEEHCNYLGEENNNLAASLYSLAPASKLTFQANSYFLSNLRAKTTTPVLLYSFINKILKINHRHPAYEGTQHRMNIEDCDLRIGVLKGCLSHLKERLLNSNPIINFENIDPDTQNLIKNAIEGAISADKRKIKAFKAFKKRLKASPPACLQQRAPKQKAPSFTDMIDFPIPQISQQQPIIPSISGLNLFEMDQDSEIQHPSSMNDLIPFPIHECYDIAFSRPSELQTELSPSPQSPPRRKITKKLKTTFVENYSKQNKIRLESEAFQYDREHGICTYTHLHSKNQSFRDFSLEKIIHAISLYKLCIKTLEVERESYPDFQKEINRSIARDKLKLAKVKHHKKKLLNKI